MRNKRLNIGTILRWLGTCLGILTTLILLGLFAAFWIAEVRLNKTFSIPAESVSIPTDSASIERGRQLVEFVRCTECHGGNLAGKIVLDAPIIAQFVAPNLTAGKGGIGKQYGDQDWVRALRHGVTKNGRSLIITPAQYYYYLSDAEVGAIVAYIKTVRPEDNELPSSTLGPLGRVFLLLGVDWFPAEKINHDSPRPSAPTAGVTVEYGEYRWKTATCPICHGQDFPANLITWSEADFVNALRSGIRPDGRRLNNDEMPWQAFGKMSDDELKAMWKYIKNLPPRAGNP